MIILKRKIIAILLLASLILPCLPLSAAVAGAGDVVPGTLGDVRLITGDVIELEFSTPVLNNADAQATFKVVVNGAAAEWEYLSYFAFGDYAAKPVVSIRLKNALDVGEPRGRRRTEAGEAHNQRTEHINGPIAAATVKVMDATAEKTASWFPFYMERGQSNMGRSYVYASRKAGTYDEPLLVRNGGNLTNWGTNTFTATTQTYSDEYVTRFIAEGMNKLTGRMEYLNLPVIYAGFTAFMVGPSQSVYEAPQYRELYVHGVTTDTFTRRSIKATEVPGNFDPATGKFVKPFIVGTSDDLFGHHAYVKADGTPATGNADSARPTNGFFNYGEAFLDIYYELGVVQGSKGFPLTAFNKFDDYRFDLHLADAYAKAKAAGMWQGSKMMDSVKEYYLGGAMIMHDMYPESQKFEAYSGPINTRLELQDYDYPLYWAIGGVHNILEFWMGQETVSTATDTWKNHTKWTYNSNPDNYGLPVTPNSSTGVTHEPLKITGVDVTDANRLMVKFNRGVSTLAAAATGANWRVYIDGREVTPGIRGGVYANMIELTTNTTTNRLDNGKPYGQSFAGFTQKDIDERSISAGGWIADNQAVGDNALEMGQYVGTQEAIDIYGAGLAGKIEVSYVGSSNPIKGWDDQEMVKDQKVEAVFRPNIGGAYRSPATGYYIYVSGAVDYTGYYDNTDGTKRVWVPGYYMLRNEPEELRQTGIKEVAMAAGHQYESLYTNNRTITYPTNAGGADFDFAFGDNSYADWKLTEGRDWQLQNDYTWTPGVVTGRGNQTIVQGPITYNNPGQRGIDGGVLNNGGCYVACTSVQGYHSYRLPHRSGVSSLNEIRVEGNGGGRFDTVDVAIIRDFNLALYRNESLVFHEGGHGIDSNLSGSGAYGQNLYNDFTAAFATATAPKNGMRWFTADGVRAYTASRSEYVSMGANYFSGTGREQFQGVNDGVWTPILSRNEIFRYDPYSYEVHKRFIFNGDLGLWYDNDTGNPAKRVIPADWALLKELGQTNAAYAFAKDWKSESDLISWGMTVNITAQNNPYTGYHNPLIKWVSYSNPSMWNIENYKAPTYTEGWRANIRFDWGEAVPYHAPEDPSLPPTKVMTHHFFDGSGVPMPVRPAELAALVAPVGGKIVEGSLKMASKVIVEFELEDFTGELNMDNAATSFDLRIDGALTHFYFWTFEDLGNGTAKVQLRIEWPVEDPTVRLISKATGQSVLSDAVLKLNLSKGVIEKGQYFTLTPSFSRAVASNVAVLNYTFNKNLFDYRAFEPAPGVTVVSAEATDDGYKFIVMIPDYAMKDYGVFTFSAKEDVDLKLEAQKIALVINFVEKIGDTKYTKLAIVDTVFATSDGTDPTNPPDGEFTLITLSNAIDFFGLKKGQTGWDIAMFFDYNASGDIDISDIAFIASKIVL